MDNDIDTPLTLTVEQAAKALGIGRSTAYELVRTGDIPSLRLGRRIVVPAVRVAAMLGADIGDVLGRSDASSAPAIALSDPPRRQPSRARTGEVNATLF